LGVAKEDKMTHMLDFGGIGILNAAAHFSVGYLAVGLIASILRTQTRFSVVEKPLWGLRRALRPIRKQENFS
jgi:hypothetical protein